MCVCAHICAHIFFFCWTSWSRAFYDLQVGFALLCSVHMFRDGVKLNVNAGRWMQRCDESEGPAQVDPPHMRVDAGGQTCFNAATIACCRSCLPRSSSCCLTLQRLDFTIQHNKKQRMSSMTFWSLSVYAVCFRCHLPRERMVDKIIACSLKRSQPSFKETDDKLKVVGS